MATNKNKSWMTIAASVCCVAPLLLLSLEIRGIWASTLTPLEFARSIFIVVTVAFIGLGYPATLQPTKNKNWSNNHV